MRGGEGQCHLPYHDTMIYIFVCVRVSGGWRQQLVPEGGISYEWGGGGGGGGVAAPPPHPKSMLDLGLI